MPGDGGGDKMFIQVKGWGGGGVREGGGRQGLRWGRGRGGGPGGSRRGQKGGKGDWGGGGAG